MAVVERLKQESMYELSAKKSGRCREVAVSGGSTVPQLQSFAIFLNFCHPSFLFFVFAVYFMSPFHVLSSLNLFMLLSWFAVTTVLIVINFLTRLL